ncbi:MAG TPA: hypothetical protein VLE03_08910 [Nitrospiraceae bacterium]|nr:hypothetical protein [Nitrospiraceae bacterium]
MTDRQTLSPLKLGLNVLWSTFWTGFPIKMAFALVFLAFGMINFETRLGLGFLMILASPVTVLAAPILMMALGAHWGEGVGIGLLFLLCIPIDIWAYGVVTRTLFLERLRLEPPAGIGLSLWIKGAVVGAVYLPILWFLVSLVTDTAISVSHELFETDLLKGVPVAEKISIELTLWGSIASAVLIVLLLVGVALIGRIVRSAAAGARPAQESYQGLITRWDLMRVPADQGLMLTAITGVGVALSILFWSALPVSTPHPHECCKKPEVKAQPPYKPLDALNKNERVIAQLAAQVDAIEKQKAEEEAARDKDKGKAGKAKPANKEAEKASAAAKP